MIGLVADCKAASVPDDQIGEYEERAVEWFIEKLTHPEICDALNAVAQHIQKPGTIPGTAITRIIRQAMRETA